MILRPYQTEAVAAVYDHLRSRDDNPCIVLPTASGKTIVLAEIARDTVKKWGGRILILAHVKELLEQAVEKLALMAPDLWMQIGVYSAGLNSRDTDHPIIVAGIQSVYKRAAELDAFDLIMIDECFPAGTMVSTPRGDTPIEDVYVGQLVHTALGVGKVEVLSGRPTNRLIELEMENGRTIRCTPNHRFFTESGWHKAEALEVGSRLFRREDVQALRDEDAPSDLSQSEWHSQSMYLRNGMESSDVLQRKMRSPEEAKATLGPPEDAGAMEVRTNPLGTEDMPLLRGTIHPLAQNKRTGQHRQLSEGGRLETAAVLLHLLRQEGEERHVGSTCQEEGQPDVEKDRPCPALPRWERQADCTANADAGPSWPVLGSGTRRSDSPSAPRRCADMHQDRHCPSAAEDRNRTGWQFACDDKEPQDRQTTDGVFTSQRVARITHIQCESPVPVFNLQVSGHPSYYADGVLVHNCHMLQPDGEGMYRTFLADAKVVNPNVRLIGLTATPYRMTTGTICAPDNLLNHICYEVGVRELIVQGFLCPLKTKAGRRKADTSGLHIRGGEFIAGEVEALMDDDSLVRSACREILEHTRERHSVLIFASGVQHALHIQRVLGEMGFECGFVCGETLPFERAETLRRFKDGKLKYLVNVNVLTTGFDAPNIDGVALLRPTNSPGLYYQMVGRGFRLDESKEDCLVLDFGGNIMRHGPVDSMRIEDRPDGSGEAPAKECPQCQAVIHAAYATCPECGHEFPPPQREKHDSRATTAGVLSGEVTETEYEVGDIFYSVHVKRDAPDSHPRSMRVDYRCGFNTYHSEWVCFEHTGYARAKAEAWWRARSSEPVPLSSEEAVAICEAGGVAETRAITVRSVTGEKYDRIINYQLGALPPRLDGSDERDGSEMPDYSWAGGEVPF